MIRIEEDDSNRTFASGVYFERTETIRQDINECSCDELRDMCRYLLSETEKAYSLAEQSANKLGDILGWNNVM